jgi:hypothetical protein
MYEKKWIFDQRNLDYSTVGKSGRSRIKADFNQLVDEVKRVVLFLLKDTIYSGLVIT